VLLFKHSFLSPLEHPGGQEEYCPLRYTAVPVLRKGNASRCNIK